MLSRAQIEALIPHAGSMCLLDAVERWDETQLECSSNGHRRDDHPLRRAGQLAAVHLVEYAAQAAAIHGALIGSGEPRRSPDGALAAVRRVVLEVARIDDLPEALQVHATRRYGDRNGCLYQFEARCGDRALASGQLSIMFQW